MLCSGEEQRKLLELENGQLRVSLMSYNQFWQKGVSLWNWREKYMIPVFRECWYMVARHGLWKQRTWLGWGELRGWWYEGCVVSLKDRKHSDEVLSSLGIERVTNSRTRSREQGWDGLGMWEWKEENDWVKKCTTQRRMIPSGGQRCSEENLEKVCQRDMKEGMA